MRTSNFGKGWCATGLFRLCLAVIVLLTLTAGGMALKTEPVQAIFDITPANYTANVTDCTPFTSPPFGFTVFTCSNPPENVFFWTAGTVPAWVNIGQISGVLSGCPPAGSGNVTGIPYTFNVFCTELCTCPAGGGCDPATCTILNPPCVTISPTLATVTLTAYANTPPCITAINPTFYPVAWESMPFSMTLSATGGVGPFNWTATGLPAGLAVTNPVTGVISGTPAPGTCGTANVTVTVTDAGTCGSCCPPISRSFILIVDCWANYIFYIPATGTYTGNTFTVEIGPGLTQGLTSVYIDGSLETTMGRNESETFTTQPNQLHLVTVDQFVSGTDADTRFAVIGSNQIVVGGTHNKAYFDYERQFLITTGSEPAGISQPAGIGFYSPGSTFSTTAPSPVVPAGQEGTKYVFSEWRLPDGSLKPNRDVSFNVTQAGRATALYDTYYQLRLTSSYPPVDESSWHLKDSTATWNVALQPIPLPGLWGGLGGVFKPVNASGSHLMTGAHTEEIMWRPSFMWPIIIIIIILLAIAGLGYFLYRRKLGSTHRPARTGAKKRALSRTKPKAK